MVDPHCRLSSGSDRLCSGAGQRTLYPLFPPNKRSRRKLRPRARREPLLSMLSDLSLHTAGAAPGSQRLTRGPFLDYPDSDLECAHGKSARQDFVALVRECSPDLFSYWKPMPGLELRAGWRWGLAGLQARPPAQSALAYGIGSATGRRNSSKMAR